MDMQQALRARIVEAGTGAEDRVAWNELPQRDALPFVVLTEIGAPRADHMCGRQALQFTRIQIDCWAEAYATAFALATAVEAAVVPPAESMGIRFRRASVNLARDLGEQTGAGFIHRRSLDLTVRHSPA